MMFTLCNYFVSIWYLFVFYSQTEEYEFTLEGTPERFPVVPVDTIDMSPGKLCFCNNE